MKRTIKPSSICFAAIAFLLLSCDKSSDSPNPPATKPMKIDLTETETRVSKSDKQFAFKFFENVLDEESKKPENFMVSPFSLSMALAMTCNGAAGETETQIKTALGLSDFSTTEMNGYFKKMKEALLKTDPTTGLAIANSIWTNKNVAIKPDFIAVNKASYGATAEAVDFSDPNTVKRINSWVSDNTKGLIKDVLKETNEDHLMFLLNALYFKGMWTTKFNAKNTSKMSFVNENGTTAKVDMMQQTARFNYTADQTVQALQLPYGNEAFSMIVLLPQEGKQLNDVIAQTTQSNYWNNLKGSLRGSEVDVFLPKFKTEYKKRLNDVLVKMGMPVAFSDIADFAKMSDRSAKIAFVDQFTYISADEAGTEAAAVTVVGMEMTSAGPSTPQKVTFKADKPFIYVIQENSTGAILFMGAVRAF